MLPRRVSGGFTTGIGGSLIAAGVVALAFALACIARITCGQIAPISSTAAVLASVGLCVTAWKAPPRVVVATAIGTVFALVPLALVGTQAVLTEPLATTHFKCGTPDIALPLYGLVLIFTGSVVTFPVAALATYKTRVLNRVVLVAAPAVVAMGALLMVLGFQSLRKPDPDAFLETFDETTLEPDTTLTFGTTTLWYETRLHDADWDDHALVSETTCVVHVSSGADQDMDEPVGASGVTCPRLRLYHDKGANLLVGTDFEKPALTWLVMRRSPFVLSGSMGTVDRAEVTIHDLDGKLGAPRGWVFGAMAGLLFALVTIYGLFRTRRRAALLLATSMDAEHMGGGWVALASGRRFVPELATTSAGPVLVEEHWTRPATYRDDGAPKTILFVAGTRASLRAETSLACSAWACVAIATVVMTSAPLWVARLYGLL
jgi:hypothetical protein